MRTERRAKERFIAKTKYRIMEMYIHNISERAPRIIEQHLQEAGFLHVTMDETVIMWVVGIGDWSAVYKQLLRKVRFRTYAQYNSPTRFATSSNYMTWFRLHGRKCTLAQKKEMKMKINMEVVVKMKKMRSRNPDYITKSSS
ncbi:hypothetical protein J1N35_036348 [Gossypium stocksii]|uniref:Uncharacterized protein n=1 Tax=Gossypium stocksii TaxID=47602 RepID=A0A9D3UIU0_9ROSI|nr:hypothetical protein J1N35_036348 [Gossypium stocksii]